MRDKYNLSFPPHKAMNTMYVKVFYRLFCCKNQGVMLYPGARYWAGLGRDFAVQSPAAVIRITAGIY